MQDASPAVIVLARNDTRAFADLDGPYAWTYDFKLFKRGDQSPVASSRHDMLWEKSVPLEIDLDPGDYVVHVSGDMRCALRNSFMTNSTRESRYVWIGIWLKTPRFGQITSPTGISGLSPGSGPS
jgi:hypothetical protein